VFQQLYLTMTLGDEFRMQADSRVHVAAFRSALAILLPGVGRCRDGER
jgi:hypothetical protein